MDNQHKQIKGYRDLTQEEIDKMNQLKQLAESVGIIVKDMRRFPDFDQRWASIAETHLQQGFMAAIRAVAKPTTF